MVKNKRKEIHLFIKHNINPDGKPDFIIRDYPKRDIKGYNIGDPIRILGVDYRVTDVTVKQKDGMSIQMVEIEHEKTRTIHTDG